MNADLTREARCKNSLVRFLLLFCFRYFPMRDPAAVFLAISLSCHPHTPAVPRQLGASQRLSHFTCPSEELLRDVSFQDSVDMVFQVFGWRTGPAPGSRRSPGTFLRGGEDVLGAKELPREMSHCHWWFDGQEDASERRGTGWSPGQRQDHGQADAARIRHAGMSVRQNRCPFSALNFRKGKNLGRGLSNREESPKHSLALALWEM